MFVLIGVVADAPLTGEEFQFLFPDGRPFGRLGGWGVRTGFVGVLLVAMTSAFMPGRLADLSATP